MVNSTAVIWGIPNCDTVKRMRAALMAAGWAVDFRDFKKLGVPTDRLAAWTAAVGWERLLNRQGTTWKKLSATEQAAVVDAASAAVLMRAQSSVIKRPVIEWPDGRITVGMVPVSRLL
ncbi:MAG: arsenate reductase [Betaproteobacteria bacterium]|nr:arsenate reductase [Betaproteobacteria bacterium]